MSIYNVSILETVHCTIDVEAKTKEEANKIVSKIYENNHWDKRFTGRELLEFEIIADDMNVDLNRKPSQ